MLLDQSYARERALLTAVAGLSHLCQDASFAPAKEADAPKLIAAAAQAMEAMQRSPVQNHGMFIEHFRVAVSLEALRAAFGSVTALNENLYATIGELNAQIAHLRARLTESESVQKAVSNALSAPELIERIRSAVIDLTKAKDV